MYYETVCQVVIIVVVKFEKKNVRFVDLFTVVLFSFCVVFWFYGFGFFKGDVCYSSFILRDQISLKFVNFKESFKILVGFLN